MAETLRELVVALSLDSSNFSRNMRTINAQIKEAESTFRLAGAGVENFEKTIKGSKRVLLNTVRDLSGTIGAAFTGLSVPEIGGAQLAMAGAGGGGVTNNRNVTINGLSVNVNGYEARNDNDLADTIVHRINDMLNEDGSVWGK